MLSAELELDFWSLEVVHLGVALKGSFPDRDLEILQLRLIGIEFKIGLLDGEGTGKTLGLQRGILKMDLAAYPEWSLDGSGDVPVEGHLAAQGGDLGDPILKSSSQRFQIGFQLSLGGEGCFSEGIEVERSNQTFGLEAGVPLESGTDLEGEALLGTDVGKNEVDAFQAKRLVSAALHNHRALIEHPVSHRCLNWRSAWSLLQRGCTPGSRALTQPGDVPLTGGILTKVNGGLFHLELAHNRVATQKR